VEVPVALVKVELIVLVSEVVVRVGLV